ncbi:MAG: endonuclease MutS2 [Finegoldia sp.]|nr:endonuclease MutS2 [Finegoldia sp.]
MNKKTIDILEFDKIKEKIKSICRSKLGKKEADKISPLADMSEIREELDITYEAMSMVFKYSNPPIYEINNIKAPINHVEKGGYIIPEDLLYIANILRGVSEIKKYALGGEENSENYPRIMAMISSLQEDEYVLSLIERSIVSENEISDNASRELFRIRRSKENKIAAIKEKINSIVKSDDQSLQDNIYTMRDDRYVVPVKAAKKSTFKGIVHDHSQSGQTVYMEPMVIVDLNNDLKLLEAEEREEIINILKNISQKVYEIKDLLFIDQDILTRLDFIFAKARYAIDIRATNPKINKDGYLDLKNARHPLIDKHKVVPINLYLGKTYNTLIITGPNTGGKTVSLKTVGLISLMAQAGILVPVDEGSEVAIFDEIFADIGDEQSIEQSLSTFSSHMKNIVEILNNLKENSLVLFDELGAGTDPTEGAALAISILKKLLDRNIRTIATTHYSQLKMFALTEEGVKNGSMEFDVDSLSPTYKLQIGLPGKSNAFEISRRLGLGEDVISLAGQFLKDEDKDFENILSEISSNRKEIEENKLKQEKLKNELLALRDRYEREIERAQRQSKKIIEEAEDKASKIYQEAREESKDLINQLKYMEKDSSSRARVNEIENKFSKNIKKEKTSKLLKETSAEEEIKEGDEVKILGLDQEGTVVSKPDKKGDLLVQVGILKINANVKNLKKLREKSAVESSDSIRNIIKNKANSDIKNEIDLRGHNIEEAIQDLDKYLDDCIIVGLKNVNVIHGKGTGVLRKGLQEYLRKDPRVKSIRDGSYNEGGLGVTTVKLK